MIFLQISSKILNRFYFFWIRFRVPQTTTPASNTLPRVDLRFDKIQKKKKWKKLKMRDSKIWKIWLKFMIFIKISLQILKFMKFCPGCSIRWWHDQCGLLQYSVRSVGSPSSALYAKSVDEKIITHKHQNRIEMHDFQQHFCQTI